MKEIRAWKTTDGVMFDSKKAAIDQQRSIDVAIGVKKFVDKYALYENDEEEIACMIIEHRHELLDILKKTAD